MASFNKVILIGNITRDPEMRMLPSGTALVSFGLACSRKFRNRDGNQKEETCFVDIKFFGRQAEVINEYMSKGRPIMVEGRLNFSTWTGQDGAKRSKHEIVGEQFQFLSGRQERDERPGQGAQEYGGNDQYSKPPAENLEEGFANGGGLDDVPF